MPHPTQNSEQQVLCICFMSCQGHGAWAMTGMKAGTRGREHLATNPLLRGKESTSGEVREGRGTEV